MKREPALHILASDLESLIPNICSMGESGSDPEEIMNMLFRELKTKAIKNRYIFKVTTKRKKQLDKLIKNADADVATFQRLLIEFRKSINHKRIVPISVGDSAYGMLKEITGVADEFVKTFELTKTKGYNEFISRFFMLLDRSQFGLNKFKYYKQKIFDSYEAIVVMQEDLKTLENKEGTIKLYTIWQGLMLEYGDADEHLDNEDDFIHMVFARQEADDLGASYSDYLKAQFEKMNAMNLVPNLGGLYGLNARKRYKSYRAEKYAKNKTAEKPIDRNMSEDQKKYMEIRNRRSDED